MAKLITIQEALNLVKDGDHIIAGMAASEGKEFFTHLHEIAPKIDHVTIDNCLPMSSYEFMMNDQYADKFTVNSWFFAGNLRKAYKNGNITYIPNHLHFAGERRLQHVKPNIYVGNCTPPDKHGFVSLSLSNVYEKEVLKHADIVILEINPHFPRTFGDLEVHENDIDYFVKTDYPVPVLPDAEPSEKDKKIGNNIAALINDGDSIQLGIGGIPNAVAEALMDKKDLGVHTEMLTTGFMKLFKKGAVTNKLKTLHNGKMVAAFALGTPELYDFIDNNPGIMLLDGNYVNDPYVISQNDNQVSINTTIEVDLTGQCCSESLGTRQFSGTGGQADTAIGAQNSKNGKSFIALYSTAMVRKEKGSDERIEVSKIVPTLKPGAGVSLSRNDVDYIVTEYGAVRLRGTSVQERVHLLISIAHPKFRDELTAKAKEFGYIQ